VKQLTSVPQGLLSVGGNSIRFSSRRGIAQWQLL
jgi:hypothetical protein